MYFYLLINLLFMYELIVLFFTSKKIFFNHLA